MPRSICKRRTTQAAWLLGAAVLGAAVFAPGLRPPPALPDVSQDPAGGVLVVVAGVGLYLLVHLVVLLGYLVFGVLLAVGLLSPVLLLAFGLLRYRRRRAERAVCRKQARRPPPLPASVAAPQEKPLPLLQRRFRH